MGCGSSISAKAHAPPGDAPLNGLEDMPKGAELPDDFGEAPRASTALYSEAATLTPDHPVQTTTSGSSTTELRTTTAMYANESWRSVGTAGSSTKLPEATEVRSTTAMYSDTENADE